MVAALFGCLLRRGGARAAEAGRVISVGRVSVPRECGLQGARGRAKLAPPLARRPEAESCGSGGRWGSQRARGRALCARALLSACILGGLAVRVCRGVVCRCFLSLCWRMCRSVRPLVFCLSTVCIFCVRVISKVCTTCMSACVFLMVSVCVRLSAYACVASVCTKRLHVRVGNSACKRKAHGGTCVHTCHCQHICQGPNTGTSPAPAPSICSC